MSGHVYTSVRRNDVLDGDRALRVYVSSPYWSRNPISRMRRVWRVRDFVRDAMLAVIPAEAIFYSPICHTQLMGLAVRGDYMWPSLERETVPMYDVVWEFCLPGWESSGGMGRERQVANQSCIPVLRVDPDEYSSASDDRVFFGRLVRESRWALNIASGRDVAGCSVDELTASDDFEMPF